MSEKSPLTGRPYTDEQIARTTPAISPLTGKAYTQEQLSRSGTIGAPSAGLATPQLRDDLSKYKRYGVSMSRWADHEEDRARYQSRAEKWGHGLMKAGVTSVGAVGDTFGTLVGLGEWAVTGDSTRVYDNAIGKVVDKANRWMSENYANYYTEAERNAEGLAALGYANFWADKAMNGFGYAAGSILSLYATGGVGLIGRGLNVASRGLKAYRAGKLIASGASKVEAGRKAVESMANFNRVAGAIRQGELGLIMAAGESNVEAREILHSTTERLTREYAEEQGIHPSQLSAADKAEIRDLAAHAANVAWGINMGVLSFTNTIGFAKTVAPKYFNNRAAIKGMTRDAKTGKLRDLWQESPMWKSTIDRYGREFVKDAASEAFQEGTQFAIQEAAANISSKRHKGSAMDWGEAMVEGYGEAFGSQEGIESIMLGAIVGGGMSGAGQFRKRLNRSEENAQRSKIMNAINSDEFYNIMDRAEKANMSQQYAERMQSALERGDHKAYRDAQFELLLNEIEMHQAAGSLDMFLERLDDAKKMSDEDFAKSFGIGEGVKFDKNQIVDSIKSKVREYEKVKEEMDVAFPTREKMGVDRLFMNKEDKEREREILHQERVLKQMAVRNKMGLEDVDGRISNLVTEVNDIATRTRPKEQEEDLLISESEFRQPNRMAQVSVIEDGETKTFAANNAVVPETIAKLMVIANNAKSFDPSTADEVNQKIGDLMRLSEARGTYTAALGELFAPEEQRTAYVQREQAKKEAAAEQQIVNEVREDLENADTLAAIEELEGKAYEEGVGDYVEEEIEEKKAAMRKQYKNLKSEFARKTTSELKQLFETEEDPLAKEVLQNLIAEREERNQEDADPDNASEAAGAVAEAAAGAAKEAGATVEPGSANEAPGRSFDESSGNIDEDTLTDAQRAAANAAEAGGSQAEDIVASIIENEKERVQKSVKDKQAQLKDDQASKDAPPFAGKNLILVTQEYRMTGKRGVMRVVVTPEGLPVDGYTKVSEKNSKATLDGNRIEINRKKLKTENLEGKEVEFRLQDGQQAPLQGTPQWYTDPIYVVVDGEVVGRLGVQYLAGTTTFEPDLLKNTDRKFLMERLHRGERVTATIDKMTYNNFNNASTKEHKGEAVTEEERAVFPLKKAFEASGQPITIGIVRGTEGINTLDMNEENAALEDIPGADEIKSDIDRYKPGQVVVPVKTPTGEYRLVAVSTRTLSESSLSAAKNLIKTGNSQADLAALRSLVSSAQFSAIPSPSAPHFDLINNSIAVTFNVDGQYYRIYGNQLTRLENGEQAKFEIGKYTEEEKWEPSSTGVVVDQAAAKIITEQLGNMRYQIDKSRINTSEEFQDALGNKHKNYLEYLTSGESILVTDTIAIEGSFFNDIGLTFKFTGEQAQEQQQVEAQPVADTKPVEPGEATPEGPAPFNEDNLGSVDEMVPPPPTDEDAPAPTNEELNDIQPVEGTTQTAEPTPTPMLDNAPLDKVTDARVYNEVLSVLATHTVNRFQAALDRGEAIDPDSEFGSADGTTPSAIATHFLRMAYSRKGEAITTEEALRLAAGEEIEGIDQMPPESIDGKELPERVRGSEAAGQYFRAVYDQWFSEIDPIDPTFMSREGIREDLIDRLEDYGYTVRDRSGIKEVIEDDTVIYERIYSKGTFEENPLNKISDRTKRLLSRIPISEASRDGSVFGFHTILPISEVYSTMLGATYGSRNVVDMKARLRNMPEYSPLSSVSTLVDGMDGEALATLWSNFGSLDSTTFMIMQTVQQTETNEQSSYRIYDANSRTIGAASVRRWRENSRSNITSLKRTPNPDGTGKDIIRMSDTDAKSLQDSFDYLKRKDNRVPSIQTAEHLANLMWKLGITIAPTLEQAKSRMIALVGSKEASEASGVTVDQLWVQPRGSKLANIASRVVQANAKGRSIEDIHGSGKEGTTMNILAETLVTPFESPGNQSIILAGKQVWPINLKSEMQMVRDRIKGGEVAQELLQDKAHLNGGRRSITLALMQSNAFRNEYKLDDLGQFTDPLTGQKLQYEDMTYDQLAAVSLVRFANPGNPEMSATSIPTQADRKRVSFESFPKLMGTGLGKFGVNMSIQEIIKNEVILDLARAYDAKLARARKEKNGQPLFENFDTKEWSSNLNMPGIQIDSKSHFNKLGRIAQKLCDNPDATLSEEDAKLIDAAVAQASEALEGYTANMIENHPGLRRRVASILTSEEYLEKYDSDPDTAFQKFIYDFVVTDFFSKKSWSAITRGGTTNWNKSGYDYMKRGNLISSKLRRMMYKGEAATDPTYGMSERFNLVTVKDITPDSELAAYVADNLANATVDAMNAKAKAKGLAPLSEADAESIRNEVRTKYERTNATDAQSFISMKHFRDIMQGMGSWTEEHKAAYEEYMAGEVGNRVWNGPTILPFKPLYESTNFIDGQRVPVTMKTSYMVLTDSIAKGRPVLSTLVEQMEMNDIDVVATESAMKHARYVPINLQGDINLNEFADKTMSLDSRGLGFPQDINDKDKTYTNNSRQLRKNMIANVLAGHNYLFPGLKDGKKVKIKGSKMLEIFQKATAAKVDRDFRKLEEDFGYIREEFESLRGMKQSGKYLIKMRDRLMDMARDKGLPDNVIQALRLEVDQLGESMLGLPIGFPQFQRRFDSLFFSIVRKSVYQQKLPGTELVQFAEFGPHEETGELKFLRNEDGRIQHAEIEINLAQLRDFGFKGEELAQLEALVGQDLDAAGIPEALRTVIAYRIPNASKAFTIPLKIKRILPSDHKAAVRVPAQITTLQGSDFDVDKLFVIFPEVNNEGNRIVTDWNLFNSNEVDAVLDRLSDEAIHNLIIDTYESIATDPMHADETVAPEGIQDIKDGLQQIGLDESQRPDIDVFNPASHWVSARDNMMSHAMRGIYANAIAGRNVIEVMQNMNPGKYDIPMMPILVTDSQLGQATLNRVETTSKFRDMFGAVRTTDYYLAQYLSAAVDSAKDPLQAYINDNPTTANLTVMLISMGMTPQQVIKLMTSPAVRGLTAEMAAQDVTLPSQMFSDSGKIAKSGAEQAEAAQQTRVRIEIDGTDVNLSLDFVDKDGKVITTADPEVVFEILAEQASQLSNLYGLAIPDNIDKSGTMASHQAYMDKTAFFSKRNPRRGQRIAGGPQLVDDLLNGDAAPIAAMYHQSIGRAMQMATDAGMLGMQPSLTNFKGKIKNLINDSFGNDRGYLSEAEHRYLNTIVSHYLATKPGSPLYESGYLDVSAVRASMLAHDTNIVQTWTQLNKINDIASLSIMQKLRPAAVNRGKNTIYKLEMESVDGYSEADQNLMMREWDRMLNHPETFGLNEKATKLIQQFAKDLVTNAIVTTGFEPGPKSMFSLIPSSVFGLEVGQHFAEQVVQLNLSSSELNDLYSGFVANYGHHKFDPARKNPHLFPVVEFNGSPDVLTADMIQPFPGGGSIVSRKPKYIIVNDAFGRPIMYSRMGNPTVMQKPSYTKVTTKGEQGLLIEMNLRDADGNPMKGSLLQTVGAEITTQVADKPVTNVIDAVNEANPGEQLTLDLSKAGITNLAPTETIQTTVGRLTKSFADAGISGIKVVERKLQPGLKGYVQGNTIYIDPAQITADTIGHEFAHILVDMLPTTEVMGYAAQVERARPGLAKQVRETYASEGLTEERMMKEILVTAIGIEGAKIQRKNPSKLQRVLNRFFRFLADAFYAITGVRIGPDAAAMLADKMFAGEMRDLRLSGKFSEEVNRSRDLQTEVEELYDKVATETAREIRRLELLPRTEMNAESILRLKELKKTAKRLVENRNDIQSFLRLQEHVVLSVQQARDMRTELDMIAREGVVNTKDALDVLQRVDQLRMLLDSLTGENNIIDALSNSLDSFVGDESSQAMAGEIVKDLNSALRELKRIERDFIQIQAPLAADALLSYGDSEVNKEIDALIEQTIRTKDISGINKKNPKWMKLQAERRSGAINEATYERRALEIKVEDLKNKKVGREQLIKELTEAQVDKSGWSYWMDPMVYSSEQNMQLFALALKAQLTTANENSRDLLYSMQEQYDRFQAYKGGGFDVAKFNEDIITTRRVKHEGEWIDVLHLVQKFDVDKFYKKKRDIETKLKEEAGWPKNKNGRFLGESDPDFRNWRKKNWPKYNEFKSKKAAWYQENTEKIDGAEKEVKRLKDKMQSTLDQISEIRANYTDAEGNWAEGLDSLKAQDRHNILFAKYYELQGELSRSYIEEYDQDGNLVSATYTGNLTQPSSDPAKGYISEKWKKIQATPELKEYYDFMVKTYHAAQEKVGKNNLRVNNWDKYSYQLPNIRKEDMDRFQEQGALAVIKDITKSRKKLSTDEEYGQIEDADGSVNNVPVLYTGTSKASDITNDVASSIMQFAHMANMFEAKAEMQGLVNTMLDIHENREVLSTDPTTGMRIKDTLASIAGLGDKYRTEGKSQGKQSNNYKHLKSFIEANYYGQFDIEMSLGRFGEANKVVSAVSVMTALNSLSLNLLQAGNQAVLDNLMLWEEGWAGQFFGRDSVAWARNTYAMEGAAMADLGKLTPTSKLGQAMTMFDALVDVTDSMGKQITGGKLKKLASKDTAFGLQHAIEHQTSARRMLALMHATKGLKDKDGKLIMNEEGKEANLWDVLIKDKKGKLIVDPRVANFNQAKFISKLHGISKRTNQIKGRFDKPHLQRTAIGKLVMLFRNFFEPGLRKRFGHGDGYHIDHELGTVTRGMYLSFFDYVKASIKEGAAFSQKYSELSDVDKQNVRRTLFEASALLGTVLIASILGSMFDDEEPEDVPWAASFLLYQNRRLQTELLQFVSPGEAIRILDSPTATANLFTKWLKLVDDIQKGVGYSVGLVDEDKVFYQRRTKLWEKGDPKIYNSLNRILPIVDGINTSRTPEEKIKFLE